MANLVYMVFGGMENADSRKKFWSSMLLTAQASGRKIFFHAYDQGVTSSGRQVLQPYYMRVKPQQ